MPYPTAEDLQAFAMNAGVISAGADLALDYGRVLSSVIAEFETDTGYVPFLATTQTRMYDFPYPDGTILDLRCGLLSVTSVTISGTTLTNGVEYNLYPLNAPLNGKPYTWLEFVGHRRQVLPWSVPATIGVTGSFGYAATCPEDVKHAILCKACSDLAAIKSGAATGTVTSIKQDDVQINYQGNNNPTGLTPQQLQLEEAYTDVVTRYRRMRLL